MADLANQPLHDGYAYFTPDQGRFFIDVELNSPPYFAHASSTVNGKTIYRIELETKIWKDLQDDVNEIITGRRSLILKGGTEVFQYDGTSEVEIDIRPDWNETNQNSISFIRNKPTIINVGITMDDNAKTMFITIPATGGQGV